MTIYQLEFTQDRDGTCSTQPHSVSHRNITSITHTKILCSSFYLLPLPNLACNRFSIIQINILFYEAYSLLLSYINNLIKKTNEIIQKYAYKRGDKCLVYLGDHTLKSFQCGVSFKLHQARPKHTPFCPECHLHLILWFHPDQVVAVESIQKTMGVMAHHCVQNCSIINGRGIMLNTVTAFNFQQPTQIPSLSFSSRQLLSGLNMFLVLPNG